MKQYEEMTSKELKEIAKARKISNWWNMKKDQLIYVLKELDAKFAEEFDSVEIEVDDKPEEVEGEKIYKDEPIPPQPEEKAEEKAVIIPKRGQLIEFNGKAQNICAWAKELGVSANTLYGRLYKLGWPIEKAFGGK